MAILRDLQLDPVSENLVHVDLQEVNMDKPIQVTVALHHVGEAVGVRDTQGILEMVLREVQVSCLPANIPEDIKADVSNLAIGDVLTVADLAVPDGVRVLTDRAQAVATVAPPAAEEVAAPVAAVAGGGGCAGRAGSAHRAQAQGRARGRGEGQEGKEERVSGPGDRRARQPRARVPRHAAQHGRPRARRPGQEAQGALPARGRPPGRPRQVAGRRPLPHQARSAS